MAESWWFWWWFSIAHLQTTSPSRSSRAMKLWTLRPVDPELKPLLLYCLVGAITLVSSSFFLLSPCFQVVQLISTEILPFANFIPKNFVGQIMAMLNRGSIHSQSASFTGKAAHSMRPFSVYSLLEEDLWDLFLQINLTCLVTPNSPPLHTHRGGDRGADEGGLLQGLLWDVAAVLLQQQGVNTTGGSHLQDGAGRAAPEVSGRPAALRRGREAERTLPAAPVRHCLCEDFDLLLAAYDLSSLLQDQ